MFAIKKNPPQSLTKPENWSAEFNDFVRKCLIIDPAERPNSTDLLEHDFITKYAKNKAILTELVLNSIDAIERYRH